MRVLIVRAAVLVAILFSLLSLLLALVLTPFQDWDESHQTADTERVLLVCLLLATTALFGFVASLIVILRANSTTTRSMCIAQTILSVFALGIGIIKWFGHYQG